MSAWTSLSPQPCRRRCQLPQPVSQHRSQHLCYLLIWRHHYRCRRNVQTSPRLLWLAGEWPSGNDHLAVLINSTAAQLQQQRLQLAWWVVSSFVLKVITNEVGRESRDRAHCKLIDALQQLISVCRKPVKPPDGRALSRSEMSLDEGKRDCTCTCA